jgi:hypothetical protein
MAEGIRTFPSLRKLLIALVAAHFPADHRRCYSLGYENPNFLVFLVFPPTYEQRERQQKHE